MQFALDNDAYIAYRNGKPWKVEAWINFLNKIKASGLTPRWLLVPDVVGRKIETIESWRYHYPIAKKYGWPIAFAAQDGMTQSDVPSGAQIVFVGGTTTWKWKSLPMWCENFPRVHVGRVNTFERLQIAERNGAESCDGSGFLRCSFHNPRAEGLRIFIEGHRDKTLQLL